MSNQLWSQLLQSQLQRQEPDLTAGGWSLQVDAFHAISHETPRRTAVQTRQQRKQKEAPAAWMKDSRGETWNQQQAAERKHITSGDSRAGGHELHAGGVTESNLMWGAVAAPENNQWLLHLCV